MQAADLRCPRCSAPLVSRTDEHARDYRTNAPMRAMVGCRACNLEVVSSPDMGLPRRVPEIALRRTALVRKARPTRLPCPQCGRPMIGLELAWGNDQFVVECCHACDMVVADDGEFDRMTSMLRSSARLEAIDMHAFVQDAELEAELERVKSPLERLLTTLLGA